ncbi:hypothetical protein [Nonomuraea typhae]|uniref:hypothetical protein n=1 Tax=Nonomuraea typhae TaxID=2603600 RepID=UPI0012FCDD28|nr:hypothetical protein [Nonomuraea typhae]
MATGSRMMVSLAATIAVAAVVVAAAGTVIAGRARPSPSAMPRQTLMWSPGSCAARDGARFSLTPCARGQAEVLTLAADPPGRGDCPDDTDEVVRLGGGRTACVRNFQEPHPGRPGQGGGVLRAGDCVALDGRERPCSSASWYGRAVAVTGDATSCPPGTLDTLDAPDAVVCLGKGGGVLAAGMCVAAPRKGVVRRSAISGVPCASSRAWARVTGIEKSARGCPKGSDRFFRARGAYRPVTCLHLVSK